MNPGKIKFSPYYFPDFDALRWIAFLLVFMQHSFFTNDPQMEQSNWYIWFVKIKNQGHLGMDLFFVLSGFLISFKILEERVNTQAFSLKNFVIRRTLRIWPLYFLIVFLGFVVVPYLSSFTGNHVSLPKFWYYMCFLANYYIRFHGNQFLFFLVFLWSVSVEEQFYISWALALKYIHRWFAGFLVSITLIAIVYHSMAIIHKFKNLYFDTLIYIPDFSIGAFFAIISIQKNKLFRSIENLPKTAILIIYMVAFILLIFNQEGNNHFIWSPVQKCLIAFSFGFIMVEQSYCKNSFFKLRHLKTAEKLGKISYGLYCFHGIVITGISLYAKSFIPNPSPFFDFFLVPIFVISITIIISLISYHKYEKLFLRLKSRYW